MAIRGWPSNCLTRPSTPALEAGLYDEANRAAERMASLAERSDETARFLADLARGDLAWWRGDPEHGMQLVSRAVSRLEADPVLAFESRAPALPSAMPGVMPGISIAPGRATTGLWSWPAAPVRLGHLPYALGQASLLDEETGRWSQALAHASQALDLARATGQPFLACDALVTMADVEAAQGRDEDCLQHAREADQLAAELGVRPLQLLARRSQALLEFSRGRIEEAITSLRGGAPAGGPLGDHPPVLLTRPRPDRGARPGRGSGSGTGATRRIP